jgi:hypothetical protein
LGSRSHTTFKKRQKEQARSEKAREKMEKRMQRKLEKSTLPADGSVIIDAESDLDDNSLDVLDVNSLDLTAEETEPASSYPRPK